MADVQASQAFALAGVSITPDVRASQFYALAGVLVPTQGIEAAQGYVLAGATFGMDIQTSQAYAMVAVLGRRANPVVRAWTYSLDGHDFYVLHLGDAETLVWDMTTLQWARWSTEGLARWRLVHGINWPGADNYAASYGSNILVGDDTLGVLYFLDPGLEWDEDAEQGSEVPTYFKRQATGQVVIRGATSQPCFEVMLTGSLGEASSLSDTVTLYTSDDAGHTYDDHGALTVTAGDYTGRFSWGSLGQMAAPGRLFRVEDYGAIARIDGLDLHE